MFSVEIVAENSLQNSSTFLSAAILVWVVGALVVAVQDLDSQGSLKCFHPHILVEGGLRALPRSLPLLHSMMVRSICRQEHPT